MKNLAAVFLGVFSVLVLVAIIVMAYLMLHHPAKVAPLNEILEKTPLTHRLVVIDFDDSGLLDEAELMQGKDGIIIVKKPAGKNKKEELFNSASAFQRLDANKDGRIDASDPMYPYLQLMFFTDNGKNRRYVTFAQADIKSIQIDQKRLNAQQRKSLNPKDNIIGEAILINGKKHVVRLISIAAAD